MAEDRVSIEISRKAYEKAKKYIEENGGFKEVSELVEFLIEEALSVEDEGLGLSPEEEEKVKERLRDLGYI